MVFELLQKSIAEYVIYSVQSLKEINDVIVAQFYKDPPLQLSIGQLHLQMPMPDCHRPEGASGPLHLPMPVFNRPALQMPMPVKWRESRGNGGSIGKMK